MVNAIHGVDDKDGFGPAGSGPSFGRGENYSWTNGIVKRISSSERRRPVSELLLALGAVRWALDSAYRERLGTLRLFR